jgi:hypothetical protein
MPTSLKTAPRRNWHSSQQEGVSPAPANGGNFARRKQKVENHRRIVAQMPNPLLSKFFSRDDNAGGGRFSPIRPVALTS